MLQVTFAEITRILEQLDSSVPAAEGHGALCGALCASEGYSKERWLDEIVPDRRRCEDPLCAQALGLLFTDTRGALRGDQMELELLLPHDDVPLHARAAALAQWCQGFLYGFGTGALLPGQVLPETVNEVLRDLTQIGRASVEPDASGETDERAYAEVVEYVRAAVQLMHDELGQARALQGGNLPTGEPDASGADNDPSRWN